MNIHKNARLTPLRREEMALSVIEGRLSQALAARVHGVSAKIVARWAERFKSAGRAGMVDRSSRHWHRPHGSLGSKPPISRLVHNQDNLLRLHI
jgi:transposase-like protein